MALTVLTVLSENLNFIFLTHVLMFELFMYVYHYCNALSSRFFAVDRALNSYFMIMIIILERVKVYVTDTQNRDRCQL